MEDKYRNVKSRESHSVKSNKAISKRLMWMVALFLTALFFEIEEASLCRCLLQTAQFEKQSLFTKDSSIEIESYLCNVHEIWAQPMLKV